MTCHAGVSSPVPVINELPTKEFRSEVISHLAGGMPVWSRYLLVLRIEECQFTFRVTYGDGNESCDDFKRDCFTKRVTYSGSYEEVILPTAKLKLVAEFEEMTEATSS